MVKVASNMKLIPKLDFVHTKDMASNLETKIKHQAIKSNGPRTDLIF